MSKTFTAEPEPVAEQASARAGRISRTIGYYAVFVLLGITVASLGPTLPNLASHTRSQISQVSILFVFRALGYLTGSLGGGRLYDRLPGNRLMAAALVLMACSLALAPVIPLIWILGAVMLFLGIGEGAVDVGGNTLLVWTHGDRVGPFMNGLHFFYGIGAFLSPIILAQVLLISGDIHWGYWVFALLLLLASAWMFRLPSPAERVSTERSQVYGQNKTLLVLLTLFFFLFVGAEASYGGWIFTYTLTRWQEVMGSSGETVAALLTSVFWASFTIARLLAIPIAARAKPASMIVAGLFGCVLSVGVVLLFPDTFTTVWISAIGMGASIASIFPTTLTLAQSRMAITGRVTGWFFVGSSLGGMVLPWLIGQLFETAGPQATMSSILVDVLLAIAVFAWILLLPKQQARIQPAG